MASISELLVSSALEQSQKAPDLAGGFAQGAQLAQNLERLKLQREELEQKKVDIKNQKLENMTNDILKARKIGGKALSGYKEFLKNKAKVLKLDDIYTPEAIDLVTSVPENIDRFDVLVSKVTSGELDYETAAQTLKDEGLFYEVDPVERERLQKAAETAILEQNKAGRAETMAQATTQRAREARQEAGEVELDKKLAAEASKFKGAGGESAIDSKIRKLDDVIKQFKSGKLKTGNIAKSLPGIGSDMALKLYDKELKAARDTVKSAINVKSILDSQFSDRALEEVQNNLGIDSGLPTAENIRRLEELSKSLKQEKSSKVKEFRSRGYVEGAPQSKKVKGKAATRNLDVVSVRGKEIPADAIVEAAKQDPNLLKEIADDMGTTLDQLKEDLGIEESEE